MHSTSALWKQILAEDGHHKEIKVTINGVEYAPEDDRLIRASFDIKLFDAPSVGGAISQTVELELMPWPGPRGAISPMSEIRRFARLVSADGERVSEYIPKGVFYSDTVKRDSDTGAVTITAFDAIMRMERQFGDAVAKIVFADGYGGFQRFVRTIGDPMPTPPTPTHDGVYLSGWYPDPAATPTVERDMLFTAVWARITITYPAKTDYVIGDALDYEGLAVTETLSDGTERDITADCAIVPAAGTPASELGDLTVSVSYNGVSIGAFTVSVTNIIASGDWWTLYADGLLDIYCNGSIPNYSYNNPAPWYEYNGRITKTTLRNSVTGIGSFAFYQCHTTEITIPNSVTSINSYAFYFARLDSITIPASVTIIGQYAFSSCHLTSVEILGNIREISYMSFYSCQKLTTVTMPDSVENIAYGAFWNCVELKNITLSSGLNRIERNAFMLCYELESVTIPEGVTQIQQSAFQQSGLKRVSIPVSMRFIDAYAFGFREGYDDLPGKLQLTDVYYAGTAAQWGQIRIGDYNNGLTSATIHYNS